jgi:hypothetical protein
MSLGISLSRRGDQIDRRRVRRFVKAHGRNHRPARTEETFLAETLGRGRSVLWIPQRFLFQKAKRPTKYKQRFEKNRDKLFTFLRYDGVPWNNNNAEHAIKAFARPSGRYRWNVHKKRRQRIPHTLSAQFNHDSHRLSLGRGPSGPSCLQRIVGHRR